MIEEEEMEKEESGTAGVAMETIPAGRSDV